MINTFSYGIPFVSNKIFFEADCECKRIRKTRNLCSELDKNDQLEGMKDINLSGIIIDSNSYKRKNTKRSNSMRFRELEKKNEEVKNLKCNCEKNFDGILGNLLLINLEKESLFCEQKCKIYRDYIKNINSYYDSELEKVEKYFDKSKEDINREFEKYELKLFS